MKRGRDKFNQFKSVIILLTKIINLLPRKIRNKLFVSSRMIKGNKGLLIRYILLKSIAEKCGDNVSIHPQVYLLNPHKIAIGNNVSIHPMCYIDAAGGISIGNEVSLAHSVTIMSSTHQYSNLNIPIKDQPVELNSVEISNNVWVGAKATILCGKKVEDGSVIGAHALVTKDVLTNTIVGGVPAKVIKERK